MMSVTEKKERNLRFEKDMETKLYRPRGTDKITGREVYLCNFWDTTKKHAQSCADQYEDDEDYCNTYLEVKTKREVVNKNPRIKIMPKFIYS